MKCFKKLFELPLLLIPILTALLYLSSYRYHSGVFDYFNISKAYIEISLPEFLSLAGTFMSGLTVFFVFAAIIFILTKNARRIRADRHYRRIFKGLSFLLIVFAIILLKKLFNFEFNECAFIIALIVALAFFAIIFLFLNCIIKWIIYFINLKIVEKFYSFFKRNELILTPVSVLCFVIIFLWGVKEFGYISYQREFNFEVLQDTLVVIKKNTNNVVAIKINDSTRSKQYLRSNDKKVYIINSNSIDNYYIDNVVFDE